MMLRTFALTALVALVVGVPLAESATRTIQLTERQTYFHETDNAPRGPSASDVITIRGVLFSAGRRVGHDAVRCSGDRRCVATLSFERGTLVGRGVQRGAAFSVPIVVGTGTFAGAHGTIKVVLGRTRSRYQIEVR